MVGVRPVRGGDRIRGGGRRTEASGATSRLGGGPGETPEPLEDYQRISMAWSRPNLPDVHGEASIWIKKATVEEFRRTRGRRSQAICPTSVGTSRNGECQEVNELADKLIGRPRSHGLTSYLEVALVLDMVQNLRYVRDIVSKGVEDYWRFALETLSDKEGLRTSRSCASRCSRRWATRLLLLPAQTPPSAFAGLTDEAGVWVEAADGERCYCARTAQDGWNVNSQTTSPATRFASPGGTAAALSARKDPALRRVDQNLAAVRGLLMGRSRCGGRRGGPGALAALAG